VQVVDLYDLLLHGIKSDLLRLDNGDTVLVPPIGPEVTIEGMVRRPPFYELKDEKNLASVLELAGGLLPTAALKHIEVQRLIQHDKQTMLSLDIAETGDAAAITKELESFEIHAGDRIRIFPIASYNQDAIYLDATCCVLAATPTAKICASPMSSLPTRICCRNHPPLTPKSFG